MTKAKMLQARRDQALIKDYKEGTMLYTDIAFKYGITTTGLWYILHRNGIKCNRKDVLKGKRCEIVRLYKTGKYFGTDIARMFGVAPSTITNFLNERGLNVDGKTYTVNEHAFDSLDTEESQYWAGMLFGDGHNKEKEGVVELTLSVPDHTMLYRFTDFLKSNHRIFLKTPAWNKKSNDNYGVDITSRYMSERLASLGMVQRKTWELKFPIWITLDNFRHFLRGYFDANGSVLTYKKNYKTKTGVLVNFCIASTEDFLKGVQQALAHLFPHVHTTLCKNGNTKGWLLQVRSMPGCRDILTWLYADATVYIPRKKKAADRMLKEIRRSLAKKTI